MTDSNTVNATVQPRVRSALESVRPELAAIGENKLEPIMLEIQHATSTARGALTEIMTLRPQIVAAVPGFDVNALDKLELYALALLQADASLRIATASSEPLVALGEEGARLRALMLSDANALALRGLLNGASLSHLKGPNGYRNISADILAMATLLRSNWGTISNKTGVSLEELDRAEVVAEQLNKLVGDREQAPATAAAVSLERQQVYTLFVRAYDQVRRAVTFLRWDKGDADEIAPSLYAGRTATRKKADKDEEKPATTTQPAATAVVATNTTNNISTNTPVTATNNKPAVGLPGADPFTN
jgi:hypothetical protein